MMKLVLALQLAVCAFAIPTKFAETDVLVPETQMVQAVDMVADLKFQFSALQVQLKSGMKVTPGVKATIEKMVSMVETKIEPAIENAHVADQDTLNTLMSNVQLRNNAWDEQNDVLQQDGNNVRTLIDDEQAKSGKWEAAAGDFTTNQNTFLKSYGTQTMSCCTRDRSGLLRVEYVPASASCDYKKQDTSGGCADRARAAVSAIVKGSFEQGLAKYTSDRKSCSDNTVTLGNDDTACQNQFEQCGRDKIAATDAATLAASEQKRMQAAWDSQTAQYATDYSNLIGTYDTKKSVVKSDEKDRVAEWGAVQIIKCALNEYKAGGAFSDEMFEKCGDAVVTTGIVDIGYPTRVAEKQPVLQAFEAQADDSAYQNTCDKRAAAPAHTCVVEEARAIPSCNTHASPNAPTPTYHSGPWNGEKEGNSWSLSPGDHILEQ